MSSPPTKFRTHLRIPLELVNPPMAGDKSVLITTKALNDQGSLGAAWPNGIIQSCISCDHFRENYGELCELAKVRPPARVIVFGCEKYADDQDVPF